MIGLALFLEGIYRFSFCLFLFYLVFEGNFQGQAPGRGGGCGLILEEGRFNRRLFAYEFGGLIHGGAYFQNFMVSVLVTQLFNNNAIV